MERERRDMLIKDEMYRDIQRLREIIFQLRKYGEALIEFRSVLRRPSRVHTVIGKRILLIIRGDRSERARVRVKAEKLDAIETLIRGQSFIMINANDQYSVQPRLSHKGTEIVTSILAILFPDEVVAE